MCILCNLAGISSGGLGCIDLPNPGDPSAGDHTIAQTGGADVGVGAPPAFSLAQIVQQLRTQWGGSYEGTTFAWPGTGPIAYFIGGTPYPSGSGEIAYKTTMTALMISRATLAFELWDDLIARDLTPASSSAFAQIQFEYASQTYNSNGVLSTNGGTYSGAWYNGTGVNGYGTTNYNVSRSEIWLNSNWTSHNADNDMFFGGYGFQTYMHEIGARTTPEMAARSPT
jgi:serralysin